MLEVWHNVADILPRHGEWIEGRNADGRVWSEEWDESEPIGAMIEWRYIMLDEQGTYIPPLDGGKLIDLSDEGRIPDDYWSMFDRT